MTAELPVSFLCENDRLFGIVHLSGKPAKRGILMIPGRPGCREGPHRLYLELARAWAAGGYPVMRMDYRGCGDSEGRVPMFEETPQEIRAALDAFIANAPSLKEIVAWGSCAGAADAIGYANTDPRITALGLFNPWAYSARDQARTRIRYHAGLYLRKIRKRDWRKSRPWGDLGFKESIRELCLTLREAVGGEAGPPRMYKTRDEVDGASSSMPSDAIRFYYAYRTPDMARRLGDHLRWFHGKLMLVLCGEDTVAESFRTMTNSSPEWKKILADYRMTWHELPGADHNLRRPEWREQVIQWSLEWFAKL